MATPDFSFDIVSRADMMEVKNAMNQAERELENRYDFKGSKAEIQREKDDVTLIAEDEFRMDQLKEIVLSKLLKRGVDIRQIGWSKSEVAAGITIKTKLELQTGIAQDKAKALNKMIKEKGLKVNTQIQGEEIRVSSKSKDDLQKAMNYIKSLELDYPVDFVNFR